MTSITSFTKFVRVFEKVGPVETRLENLFGCLFGTEVTTTGLVMTEREDTVSFSVGNTPSNDLVGTILEKIGVVPIKMFHLRKEFVFILLRPKRRGLLGD